MMWSDGADIIGRVAELDNLLPITLVGGDSLLCQSGSSRDAEREASWAWLALYQMVLVIVA